MSKLTNEKVKNEEYLYDHLFFILTLFTLHYQNEGFLLLELVFIPYQQLLNLPNINRSMAEEKSMRLSQVAKILNKGLSSVASSLSAKGFKVEINPNTKINTEQLEVLAKEYKSTELLNGTRRAEPPVVAAEPPRRQEEDVVLYRRDDARRPIVENKPESAPADLPKPAPVESQPATTNRSDRFARTESVG